MPEPIAKRVRRTAALTLIAAAGLFAVVLAAEEGLIDLPGLGWRQHDDDRPGPPAIEPADATVGARPPEGAVVLFDGSSLDAWQSPSGGPARWKVGGGYMETVPGAGAIRTRQEFGDIQLHVEWASPDPPAGRGQDRGNSGVFLMGQFEVQVLDSFRSETYADGQAGAIYGQYPPLYNASRPPGVWQSYDIAFRRPRFDPDGRLLKPARLTLFHNGVLVQNNEEILGRTSWLRSLPYRDMGDRGPIVLQDHSHPVRFRNVWVLELPERPEATAEDLARPEPIDLPAEALERYAGTYRMGDRNDVATATIERRGDGLVVSFSFRPEPLEIVPIAESVFDLPDTDGRFTFRTDDDGRVVGALFQIGDGERELTRIEP